MAKILKCPRCQERIDVTDLSGGSTVKCEACGTMVRLPSGNTGKVPQAAPPPPPPPPAPARPSRGTTKMHKKDKGTGVRKAPAGAAPGRQTDLFKKMSSAKAPGEGGRPRGGGSGEKTQGNNTGMIIAIAAAAVVVLGGVAFAVLGKKDKDGGKTAAVEPATPKKPKKKEEPKKTVAPTPVQPTDTGVFKPGARGLLDKSTDPPMPNLTSDGRSAYEGLITGKVADVVAQDYSWVTYIIDGMLSDSEAVAKGSFEAMHQIINKRKLDASQSELGKKADVYGFNIPQTRADEYRYWAQWYFTLSARRTVDSWRGEAGGGATANGEAGAPRVAAGNAATEPWEQTLRNCRSGGFHNSSNPEYYEFQKIKGMGKSAYPHLIRFIDNEDTSLGTTAVLILKELSGRSEQPGRVTEANKAKIKEDWEGWLKSGP